MNCLIDYNEQTKKIIISADTECDWSCVVTEGNMTLSEYYGKLSSDNSFSNSAITIFTYGTNEIYGKIDCRFQNDNNIVKLEKHINNIPLHIFHVSHKQINLFGQGTRSYIYVYYGTLNLSDKDILQKLKFKIDTNIYDYDGDYDCKTISYNNIDLYKIEFQKYNEDLKYFEILITSMSDCVFNDIISVKGLDDNNVSKEYIINIHQGVVTNAPTLLHISPSIVFLNSNNPKQKVNVTSIFKGGAQEYIISNSIPSVTSSITRNTENIEEYLNTKQTMPVRNDYLDVTLVAREKHASHFIVDMTDFDNVLNDNYGNEDESENRAYELYVIQKDNHSCFQKLELFYDYIYDITNYIKISHIKGIYGYVNDGLYYSGVTEINEQIIESLIKNNLLTIYFTKTESAPTIQNDGYVYVKYSPTTNAILTVESSPNWWKIYSLANYVNEVKLNNELHLSLENIIPTDENIFITLQNEKGKKYNIYCKSDSDIFDKNSNIFAFNKNNEFVNKIELNSTFSSCTLCSYTEEEKWYYYDTNYHFSNIPSSYKLQTIKYQKNSDNEIVSEEIYEYNFPILYNLDIKKYYILYGSVSEFKGNIEVKDTNKYYLEKKYENDYVVTIPIPEKTRFVPWTIVNNGCGVQYDAYIVNNDNKWEEITFYKPQDSGTTFEIVTNLPEISDENKNNYSGKVIFKPRFLINDINVTTGIVIQQMNTLNDVTLYVVSSSKTNDKVCVNKYGLQPYLSSMEDIEEESMYDAFSNIKMEKNINSNEFGDLYYASYVKNNSFSSTQNQDVNILIVDKGYEKKYYPLLTDIFNNENAVLKTIISSSNMTWKELTENGKEINKEWIIKDGILHYYDEDTESIKKILPQNKIYEDDENNEGFMFENNETVSGSIQYFAVIYLNNNKIIINNKAYDIEKEDDVDYITYNLLYQIINKTVSFNDDIIYEIDANNILYHFNGGNYEKCVVYEENNQWYVNLSSVPFTIKNSETNEYLYISLNKEDKENERLKLNGDNYNLVYNGITYNPYFRVNLKGIKIEVLTNIDGRSEKYIILNNKKYVANTEVVDIEKNEKIEKIYLNAFDFLTIKEDYVEFESDFYVDIISEPYSEYININDDILKLSNDGYLLYEGVKIPKIQDGDEYYIIINNKGYKVYRVNSKFYININYMKYIFDPLVDFKLPSFEKCIGNATTEELINEKFHYEINFDDLLSNEIIQGKIKRKDEDKDEEYVITNGYVSIQSNDYFADETLPILKNIWVNTDSYPLEIISDEVVQPTLKEESGYTLSSITFYDETTIILEDKTERKFVKGGTFEISGSPIEFIINDYSKIKFNGQCFITFKNDCEIEVENNDSVLIHKILKNETLLINNGTIITFNDVTKIQIDDTKIKLHVFTDVVCVTVNEICELYVAEIINNKKAIRFNNEIYYIYDNQIVIDNTTPCEYYEKVIMLKTLTNNSFNSIIYKIDFFDKEIDSLVERTYGYIEGDKISQINDETIQYYINVICYEIQDGEIKWKINPCELQVDYITKTDYPKATFSHPNLVNKELLIENGILNVSLDYYKTLINVSGNISPLYTSKEDNYQFTYSGITYSIWDYISDSYVKEMIIKNVEQKELQINKTIILNDVKYKVDEKKYMKINGDYYPIFAYNSHDISNNFIITDSGNSVNSAITLELKSIINDEIQKEKYKISQKTQKYVIIKDVKYIVKYIVNNGIITYENKDFSVETDGISIQEFVNIPSIMIDNLYEVFITDNTIQWANLNFEVKDGVITISYILKNGIRYYMDESNQTISFSGQTYKVIDNSYIVEIDGTKEYLIHDKYDAKGEKYLVETEFEYSIQPPYNYYSNDSQEQPSETLTSTTLNEITEKTVYDPNSNTNYGVIYDNKLYPIINGVVTIPQKCPITKRDNEYYIEYNIDACLTNNLNIYQFNESLSIIKKLRVKNAISAAHTNNIMLKVGEETNEGKKYKYGIFKLNFK